MQLLEKIKGSSTSPKPRRPLRWWMQKEKRKGMHVQTLSRGSSGVGSPTLYTKRSPLIDRLSKTNSLSLSDRRVDMKTFDMSEFLLSITKLQWYAIASLLLTKVFGLVGFIVTLMTIQDKSFKPFAITLVILTFTALMMTFIFCAKSVLNGEMDKGFE